jgi:hypothetical protein
VESAVGNGKGDVTTVEAPKAPKPVAEAPELPSGVTRSDGGILLTATEYAQVQELLQSMQELKAELAGLTRKKQR